MAYFIVKVKKVFFFKWSSWNPNFTTPSPLTRKSFTPFYPITAKNMSKSSESNSTKNPTYETFGRLNQSQKIFAKWAGAYLYISTKTNFKKLILRKKSKRIKWLRTNNYGPYVRRKID